MIFFNKTTSLILMLLVVFTVTNNSYAIDRDKYVTSKFSNENFPLASNGKVASILMSDDDFSGVKRVVGHLQTDIFNVTDSKPNIMMTNSSSEDYVVIIGTLGKSTIINELVKTGKIKTKDLKGKWEKFITQIVENPMPGVKKALVISGSDKRGTIYGIYDLSNQIGVHPWHFWADVPAKKQSELHVLPGEHTQGEPKVKYRGLFINDEDPCLKNWSVETFGGLNSGLYDKVFELVLRMKGNYIWPAMWGKKFYVDDPKNGALADEYGIVMGTSHHEPLTRAHAEWQKSEHGEWDYQTNADGLLEFWRGGLERMGDKETLLTIGMRGDGDEAMSEETATELLETIVKDQRKLIEEVTRKPAEETPQIWALYKEVQDYYDKGMRVPDDVTLLLCDDNWGNLRKLPSLDAESRSGGYGIYYHFDYVGGPRSYKWINTNQIERTWEQMHLAYKHGVDRVWIVNVGDIKPMEFPLQFFLDYAWNPDEWNANNLQDYYTQWANEVFDGIKTEEIADVMKKYTKYSARKKHELVDPSSYSLIHYNEAEQVLEEDSLLVNQAKSVGEHLPDPYKDTYYQLVLFPVLASANLNELYIATGLNRLYHEQGRAKTNDYADKVKALFERDAKLTDYYHNEMADGKWNHMMSQPHIGYTSWNDPRQNIIPETKTLNLEHASKVGLAVEGSKNWWPNASEEPQLPLFNSVENNNHYFEVFNRGLKPFYFRVKYKSKWVTFSKDQGTVDKQERIYVAIDWEKAPKGKSMATFTVVANKQDIPVKVQLNNTELNDAKGFVETNGFISIDADNFSEKTEPNPFTWEVVENLGKTGNSVISLQVEAGRVPLSSSSPKLCYNIHVKNPGTIKVHMYFSPTIDYAIREGMYYGLSLNDNEPEEVNYAPGPYIFNYNGKVPKSWHQNVSDNIKIITTELEVDKAGNHTLNYYRVDEGLVLQRIIIETEKSNLKETYLGPPESVKID